MNELQYKISRELSEFKKFKQRYRFEFADLKEINEILYCKGKPLTDNEGKTVPEEQASMIGEKPEFYIGRERP